MMICVSLGWPLNFSFIYKEEISTNLACKTASYNRASVLRILLAICVCVCVRVYMIQYDLPSPKCFKVYNTILSSAFP